MWKLLNHILFTYRKSSIEPPGGLIFFKDFWEGGGLNREGGGLKERGGYLI